ncbi:MAG: YqgE/AlgH family protein [Rhizobiaceae bacterium]
MELGSHPCGNDRRSSLDGQFLVAMPGMLDERFARSVIYLCAHSDEGAMGLIINRAQQIGFPELLVQLDIIEAKDEIRLPESARSLVVRSGGPVDQGRGFVIHSDDYVTDSSMPVDDSIVMTATIDILRAISNGRGPARAFMALGYSGWGPGQLEAEIADNGWLTCPADRDLLFDADIDRKYDRVLFNLGIDPLHLSAEAGRA